MIVGALGGIVFTSSTKYLHTFNNLSKNTSVRYIEHSIIGEKPKIQFDGADLQSLSFEMNLNSAFGVSPIAATQKFKNYMLKGTVLRLVIGLKSAGKFVIKSISESHKTFNRLGVATKIDLQIELQEYN